MSLTFLRIVILSDFTVLTLIKRSKAAAEPIYNKKDLKKIYFLSIFLLLL